jgi:hypothetical protein
MNLAAAQETLHLLGVPRMTEAEKRAELSVHFALSQLDLMGMIGSRVSEIQETAKWKKIYSEGPVAAIQYMRDNADYFTQGCIADGMLDYEIDCDDDDTRHILETHTLPTWVKTEFTSWEHEDMKERWDCNDDYTNDRFSEWLKDQLENPTDEDEDGGHVCHLFKKVRNWRHRHQRLPHLTELGGLLENVYCWIV